MYNPAKPYKREIIKLIKKTWETPYVSVTSGTYPVIKKKFLYPEVDHTDGIGTKGYYHWQKRTFKNAVLDALAMNLNDLAMMGAVPYKLQNHIIIPEDDSQAILAIVKNLVVECRKRKIAITGGETSIQNNLEGLDISITISGFITKLRPNKFLIGNVLIGLPSNGLHANGFTRVRELFAKSFKWEFVAPTVVYSDLLLSLVNRYNISGMAHITVAPI